MKKEVMMGLVMVFFVLLLFLGAWGQQTLRDLAEEQAKISSAKEMMKELETCPEEQVPELLHRPDPWGNDLLVKYDDGFIKSLTFTCCGPDKKPNTADDLQCWRYTKLDWVAGGEKIGNVGVDLGKGIWKSLKRSFTEE